MLSKIPLLVAFIFSLTFSGLMAQGEKKKDEKKAEPIPLEEKKSVTEHRGTFGGKEVDYTATAGTLILKKDEAEPDASIFYIAYTVNLAEGEKASDRPILFCFNGGPGSSSVWLHLGGFGPKRVQMPADGTQPAPPFLLGDNPTSLLGVADLVFIDPVSTGYSRAGEKDSAKAYHGFRGDLDSVADFIRLYTTRNQRWLSPKFLAGESYGAFRAAGLADVLQSRYGMMLNGVVLVSGVLDFESLFGRSDLSALSFLPSLAHTAAFHGKLAPELAADSEKLRAEVQAFVEGEYASALVKGASISAEETDAIAEKLSRYTSLDVDLIKRLKLRIGPSRFREELLQDQGLVLGRFDARITGRDGDDASVYPGFDPSYTAVYGAFSATLKDYIRGELKFESDLVYEILKSGLNWNYDNFRNEAPNVASELRGALTDNPYLKIFIACGYEDLATPYYGIMHTINHLDVDPALLDNVGYHFYRGGHMMYTIEDSNEALNGDIAEFLEASVPE